MKIDAELLAPAGDMARLKTAIYFGADAVYCAGKEFGLRASSPNFTHKELETAVKFVHENGKKIYVTVNIFARNTDLIPIKNELIFLEKIGVDAVIVSDLGVMKIVRENTKLPIHVSTQANVLNKLTAEQYVELGAKRIVLARECSIDEIREIAKHLGEKCEIECFVHGAMCISYSGRCLLSNYLSPEKTRESNRGECNHPCRWSYALMEQKRQNQYFPIEEDARGTYILNSRDLCLVEHLCELAKAGVKSFKIEGRVKTEYYVANTVNAYRRVMNGEAFDAVCDLEKSAHRHFTTGFVAGDKNRQFFAHGNPVSTFEYTANVTKCPKFARNDPFALFYTIEMRNAFNAGDTVEVLSPSANHNRTFIVEKIINSGGESITRANRPQELLRVPCPYELHVGDILRKRLAMPNNL